MTAFTTTIQSASRFRHFSVYGTTCSISTTASTCASTFNYAPSSFDGSFFFFFSSRRRHTRFDCDWSSDVCSSDLSGYAGAGTITLGGYDYHDSTRATGESRNFKAGQMIGAVLEYAQRVGAPVMIYVFSDGSLSSSSMVDSSTAGRGKLAWQGDNSSTASTFF